MNKSKKKKRKPGNCRKLRIRDQLVTPKCRSLEVDGKSRKATKKEKEARKLPQVTHQRPISHTETPIAGRRRKIKKSYELSNFQTFQMFQTFKLSNFRVFKLFKLSNFPNVRHLQTFELFKPSNFRTFKVWKSGARRSPTTCSNFESSKV